MTKWASPWFLIPLSALVGTIAGLLLSRPASVGFAMTANTRELAFDWPCDSVQRWSIDRARIEFPDDVSTAPQEATELAIELRRADIAVTQIAPDFVAIEFGPSRWRAPADATGVGSIAWMAARGEESALPLDRRVRLVVPLGATEQSLAARGIFRLGGSVSDHSARSRLLIEGRIVGRDLPTFGGQRRTFLDESVEPGGVMLSHPDLEEWLLAGRDPRVSWERWCAPQPDEEPDYAVGVLRMARVEPREGALGISLFRRADSVGVQTMGSVAGSDSVMVRFSVTHWAKGIASATIQTGLLVVAALLTGISTLYGGLQLLHGGRRHSGPENHSRDRDGDMP